MGVKRGSDLRLYGRLLGQARPCWPHLIVLFVLSLLSPSVRLLAPLPLKMVVDNVVSDLPPPAFLGAVLEPLGANTRLGLLLVAAVAFVVIALLAHLLGLTASLLGAYTGERLVRQFRAVLFRHAQGLSLAYHDTRGTADSTYRIHHDAPALQWVVVDGLIPLLTAAFTLVAMIAVVVPIDWQLALVALAVSPVLFVLTYVYGGRLRRRSKEVKKLESTALAIVQEVLSAVRVVKAFGQEDREHGRFVHWSGQGMRARLGISLASGLLTLLVGLTIAVGTAAVLFIGTTHVMAGTLTLGGLLVVMAYLAQLYAPMETLSKKLADLQSSLAGAERAFALLDEGPDVPDRPGARHLARARGAVSFRHVTFAYTEGHPVLVDVSFAVEAGARVGIEGTTGAGKTTLVNLLTRFYDATDGQVLLDGLDLRDYHLADLRNQFAIVLQEPVLFSTTIAENIAYARPEAARDEIVAAAKAANAHDFITRLPQGYETLVGERGMRLSGGERQRIALARAFLKDAPILILDEPTSSVDVQTESLIMEALERLMSGRTTFIIAHRLGTLENCDVRLRLAHGRLVGRGEEASVLPAGCPS